eukprot:CAMPEP_0205906176 /NCGR_PEP_ID=MMETSP1325-20131115/1791_1 /ASSEMBLY_ACC=CAM_ASM_000708 /TAXON_ID=236786 /ORGANISM="Florenciella sp., Strain RCC1007" /LENGTH=224 /DNA_ID=CAMNT_0053272169 /DNA_START=205 /DNA_END=879 /DNA_ORIENTATION=-
MNPFQKKKEPTPRELGRSVKRTTQKSQRDIEREIAGLDRQEKQLVAEIKVAAKKNQEKTVRILAKQVVQLRNQREKMIGMKAHVGAVGMQASTMAATAGAVNAVGAASKAIGAVNAQMDAAGMSKAMMDFQRQIEVMGVKEEMMDEALADAFDDDEIEDEADGIVAKTLAEIGVDLDASMADAPTTQLPSSAAAEEEKAPAQADAEAAELASLEARLAALPSGS